MKLYYMPGSCALSCHIALEWAGADHQAVRLSMEGTKEEEDLAVNPKGKVPALALEDGTVMTEALAILSHISYDNSDADGPLPHAAVPRTLMLEALSELTGEFHPAFFPLHVPDRYTTDATGFDAVKGAARGRLGGHHDRGDDRMAGQDWILPEGRSAADPYLYVMCRWASMIDADIAEWPALASFAARMAEDEGVRRALAAEGLDS